MSLRTAMRMKGTSGSGLRSTRRNPSMAAPGPVEQVPGLRGLPRQASGAPFPPMSSEDDDPVPQPGAMTTGPWANVPPTLVELCGSLTDFVQAAVGIRPDYTPETLPLV